MSQKRHTKKWRSQSSKVETETCFHDFYNLNIKKVVNLWHIKVMIITKIERTTNQRRKLAPTLQPPNTFILLPSPPRTQFHPRSKDHP